VTLVLGPVQGAISSAVKVRLTFAMQDRLVGAVSRPTGIAHLEDPATLDELESARGQLGACYPADAPMTLAVVVGNRLSGLVACGVVGVYRWWLGLGLAERPQRAAQLDAHPVAHLFGVLAGQGSSIDRNRLCLSSRVVEGGGVLECGGAIVRAGRGPSGELLHRRVDHWEL
jgi:hypothetical protein